MDLCIVSSDRTTAAAGDVCNKIGTYLKALAAHDNNIPFYVGLPSPTIDWRIKDGVRDIPIEERETSEVREVTGRTADGTMATVAITPDGSPLANYAFDVTPARLVTGLITERGACAANEEAIATLFEGTPRRRRAGGGGPSRHLPTRRTDFRYRRPVSCARCVRPPPEKADLAGLELQDLRRETILLRESRLATRIPAAGKRRSQQSGCIS